MRPANLRLRTLIGAQRLEDAQRALGIAPHDGERRARLVDVVERRVGPLDAVAPDPAHVPPLVALTLAVAPQHAALQRLIVADHRQLRPGGADDREVARGCGPWKAAVGGSG